MIFPTIEQYKDAVQMAEHSLLTLRDYEAILRPNGDVWFSSGNFAVVFKMKHRQNGKLLALKCFTRYQERRQESYRLISDYLNQNPSPYLLPYNYLEGEIWANDADYPVVALDWAEGTTLGNFVKQQCEANNTQALQDLAHNIEALTAWLIEQPFAHGDLKPDNIMVRPDGSLMLVDYDGMFVPTMMGQQAREFGSPIYRHPKRTLDTYDRHLDDFSLLILLLESRLLAADPRLLQSSFSGDSLVAKAGEWENAANSHLYQALQAQHAQQGKTEWATWAAMLLISVQMPSYRVVDWSLLVDKNKKAIVKKEKILVDNRGKAITSEDKELTSYTAPINRETPCAFVFLINQSSSMSHNIIFRGEQKPKSEVVAQLVNETINDILNRCRTGAGMADYLELAVIGYGGKHQEQANFAWEGALEGRTFVKISELDTTFIEKQDILQEFSLRGTTVTRPKTIKKWISPLAEKLTPMRHALQLTTELLEDWLVRYQNKDIFPPIVINITDGAATDSKEHDLLLASKRLKNLHTIDGNILLFTIHLSDASDTPILFPSHSHELPDNAYAQLLFKMSSNIPTNFNVEIARATGKDTSSTYSGMVFNADAKAFVNMMQIGT